MASRQPSQPACVTEPRPTTRQQASRIERDYYHRVAPLAKTRRWLILAAIVAGCGWCAWAAVDAARHVSPGPLTAVHASWDHDCNACHEPLTPITDATFFSNDVTKAVGDRKCLPCHRVAGHHERQLTAEIGSCGSCHHDHSGRSADISRVDDRTCTACHADITAHRLAAAGTPPLSPEAAWKIEGFDNQRHPPFASLRADPGTIRFTHGRHMLPGQYFEAGLDAAAGNAADSAAVPRSRPFSYADLPAADRARYLPAGGSLDAPVQLSCASCHEFGTGLAATDSREVGGLLAGAAPGAYALPVDFQRHCAACHPLPFEGISTDAADAPASVVPHGLDAGGLRQFLEQTYLARGVLDDPAALLEPVVSRPLPTAAARPDAVRVGEAIGAKVAGARRFVRNQCSKCHALEDVALDGDENAGLAVDSAPWFQARPSQVPEVWLTKARFDHQAHRQYECRACHAAAYPAEAAAAHAAAGESLAGESDLVLIAGRESCAECHAPARHDPETGRRIGGARHDCVECHGYHDRGGHAPPWPERAAVAGLPIALPPFEPAAAGRRRALVVEFLSKASRLPGER